MSAVLPVLCVLMEMYMTLRTYIATCIHHVHAFNRAWLPPELSKQSCKAIVRERAYSDSICTIDVTPWGLASLACVLREIGSSTQIDQRLSLRMRSTSTSQSNKVRKVYVR